MGLEISFSFQTLESISIILCDLISRWNSQPNVKKKTLLTEEFRMLTKPRVNFITFSKQDLGHLFWPNIQVLWTFKQNWPHRLSPVALGPHNNNNTFIQTDISLKPLILGSGELKLDYFIENSIPITILYL